MILPAIGRFFSLLYIDRGVYETAGGPWLFNLNEHPCGHSCEWFSFKRWPDSTRTEDPRNSKLQHVHPPKFNTPNMRFGRCISFQIWLFWGIYMYLYYFFGVDQSFLKGYVYIYIYTHIYIYLCCKYICIYIYIKIYSEGYIYLLSSQKSAFHPYNYRFLIILVCFYIWCLFI